MLIIIHTANNPQLAQALSRHLTLCGSGLLAGQVSRRVCDYLINLVEIQVITRGGSAVVIEPNPKAAQGFTIKSFNTVPVEVIDGLALGILRKNSGKNITEQ
ncbi:type I-E CRISPR-associated endoribonuclease Cas2 [Mycobacteroides abscessus]|uniref:type I-E CRISPR-associated endoribonuclease Cas2 n=1 Tax=Mycobacteroides abscessus TaxID=36809 RepID=UPI003C735BF9